VNQAIVGEVGSPASQRLIPLASQAPAVVGMDQEQIGLDTTRGKGTGPVTGQALDSLGVEVIVVTAAQRLTEEDSRQTIE